MSEFTEFLTRLTRICGLEWKQADVEGRSEYEVAAGILHEVNSFFYQQKVDVTGEHISEFHEYWEKNHEKILSPRIDPTGECLAVARILERIYSKNTIKVQLDTLDLDKEEVANVRFFTAIQDFNIDIHSKGNPFEFFKRHPDCFNPDKVVDNELLVDELLNYIGAESQRDKRKPWMLHAARLLRDRYGSSAFNINSVHEGDVEAIVSALSADDRYGFSTKKAHMFLRDMADLGVWKYSKNADKLDVMSDKNTMRVALRTGILQFRIPLLASYLDVYCYQYQLADRMCRQAWRRVWEQWGTIRGHHRPPTPASMDYLIYRLGKTTCRGSTRICAPNYPVDIKKLESLIPQDRLVFGEDRYCVFNPLCDMKRKILNPPNSISIMGRTGWERGRTNEGGGGGISS